MGSGRNISESIQEIWTKLNDKWQGEDADAFYKEYISRIMESTQLFESSCLQLKTCSEDLLKEMQAAYQSFQK